MRALQIRDFDVRDPNSFNDIKFRQKIYITHDDKNVSIEHQYPWDEFKQKVMEICPEATHVEFFMDVLGYESFRCMLVKNNFRCPVFFRDRLGVLTDYTLACVKSSYGYMGSIET